MLTFPHFEHINEVGPFLTLVWHPLHDMYYQVEPWTTSSIVAVHSKKASCTVKLHKPQSFGSMTKNYFDPVVR